MRIIFMGSPDFAIPSLVALYKSEHEIVSVVSGLDKRRGRGKESSPTPVKAKAVEFGLPVIEVENLKSEFFAKQIRALKPDLLVVVAFRILPVSILEIPEKGSINLHASLLPKYRGAAPIHRAVMNGEKETGCSIFFLEEKVDTGKVILQGKTPIGENETTGDVYERLMHIGADLVVRAVGQIEDGTYQPRIQDHTLASSAPKIFTEDCEIDFSKPALVVHNKIRGLSPFPSARTHLDGNIFKIYRCRVAKDINLKQREIYLESDHVYVGCLDGSIELAEVQLQGKKVMSALNFFRGYKGEKQITS